MVRLAVELSSSVENFFRFVVALVFFALLVFAAYYVSKWTAGYQKARMSTRNFEIIDSMRIAANKYFLILRVGKDRFVSVGVGKDEMVFLGEYAREDLIWPEESVPKSRRESMKFANFFSSFGEAVKKSGEDVD